MNNWVKISIFLFILILVVVGFLAGYLINNQKSCKASPFVFGVERVEKLNDINVSCVCISIDSAMNPFYFDDEGIYDERPSSSII